MVNLPPSRRFSAAPFLNCPHKATSAAQSLMSLSQTFSIDSSESMITVIHLNRGHDKRSSNGSLICNDSTINGSYSVLPRSPLSPRSPSRCSPSLLTPNASEPPPLPFETIPGLAQAASIDARQSLSGPSRRSIHEPCTDLPSGGSDKASELETDPIGSGKNPYPSPSSNVGTSGCRNLVQETVGESVQFETAPMQNEAIHNREDDNLQPNIANESRTSSIGFVEIPPSDSFQLSQKREDKPDLEESPTLRDPLGLGPFRQPEFRSAVNDFCVRHSREELEFLIGQVGHLRISDCYFSEKRTTLCMVIEVKEK